MGTITWFVKPEVAVVPIAEGHTLDLKKRLTVGESSKAKASLVREVRGDGRVTPDFEMIGKSEVMAYLVDWSLRDDAGNRIDISTDSKKLDAINALSEEAFKVISDAVEAHVKAMEAAQKKSQAGESASSATSTSAE